MVVNTNTGVSMKSLQRFWRFRGRILKEYSYWNQKSYVCKFLHYSYPKFFEESLLQLCSNAPTPTLFGWSILFTRTRSNYFIYFHKISIWRFYRSSTVTEFVALWFSSLKHTDMLLKFIQERCSSPPLLNFVLQLYTFNNSIYLFC